MGIFGGGLVSRACSEVRELIVRSEDQGKTPEEILALVKVELDDIETAASHGYY